MEYCAVQCPLHETFARSKRELYSVENNKSGVIAALCTEDDFLGLGAEILNFRADNIISCILESTGYHEHDMKSALESGFTELDYRVRSTFGAQKLTKFCTVVAIVDFERRMVYRAGVTNAKVVMLPSSRMRTPSSGHPIISKFQQEPFKDDTYLLIASIPIFGQYIGKLTTVLETRIRAAGLVEACKSIVGRYKDESKTLIVVTLRRPVLNLAVRRPASSFRRARTENDNPPGELGDTLWGDYDQLRDPRALLRPLVEGELSQTPEPCTTLEYVTYGTRSIGHIENILFSCWKNVDTGDSPTSVQEDGTQPDV